MARSINTKNQKRVLAKNSSSSKKPTTIKKPIGYKDEELEVLSWWKG